MRRNHLAKNLFILRGRDLLEFDHAHVASRLEFAVFVEDERDAARHARREVPSGPPEHDDHAARHVLAAVIAGAFDDGPHAAVAHRKPLTGHAVEIGLARGGAVQRRVPDQNRVFEIERRALRRDHDDLSAREPLAAIVVRLAFEME